MRKFKFQNWILATGVMLAYFGITNVASVVSATLSSSGSANAELVDEVDTLINQTLEGDQGTTDLTQSESSFMAPVEFGDQASSAAVMNSRLLSELYDAEMRYAEDFTGQGTILPTPTAPEIPLRLVIPKIELDAPVIPVKPELANIAGKDYEVWHAPDEFGVGWHSSSATLGVKGNTVLNGHHNVKGEVFKELVNLEPGDEIIVHSEAGSHSYVILNRMIFAEKYAPIEQRIENAQWILPSDDERLTLITCWPYESNTHRLVLVARPVTAEN